MVGRRTNPVLAASFALAILAVLASSAHAGTYHVYSCRMPNGQAAPADGWVGSVAPGGAYDDYALNTCAEGGALVAALGDATIHDAEVDRSTWSLAVPQPLHLTAAMFWRSDETEGGFGVNSTYETWLASPNINEPFDECIYTQGCKGIGDTSSPMAEANRVVVPSARLGSAVYVNASCSGDVGRECPAGQGDSNGFATAMYLYAADLTVEQTEGPHVSAVTGELTSAPAIRGQSDVAFDATDAGSGVYEAVFNVDGQTVQRTVVDDNGGRCRDVGQTSDGAPAFLYLQPCLASASADVPFDSTSVANGAHHLVVDVIDAAGNAAPVLDRTVTIANPPPPGVPGPLNGTNASTQAAMSVRWSATRRTTLLSGYGHSQVVTGRLTGPGGAPIVGAAIDVRAMPAYAGAGPVVMSSPHTDSAGRFSVRLPRGVSSRTLDFAYRAHVGDALPVVTRTLQLRVRAGVALRVSPHTTSVGSTISFRGRLLGGPVPRGGKQLVLEARSPGSAWIEFKVVHTDAHGRYRSSYRFKFPGPANYSFRARSELESDYPYAPGASNVVHVHER
jgi:hypothetical protein